MFKIFKAEVKYQLNKRIKNVQYDHSDEYYNRYNGLCEQSLGPFVKFLVESRIIP